MAITMVRKPSETPNISNTDDFIGLRYAYGNQDGYVIGKGKELESQDDGSKFIIQSGRIVLQGVECDIDANGVLVPVDNISTKSYYTVYLEVNLAINESKIVARFDTVDYPKIDKGDDLTKNISGTARLELYRFVAQDGLISNVEKIIKPIEYINRDTLIVNSINSTNSTNSKLINNLDIKRNVKDKLTINSESETTFIPQRRLVWTGNAYCNSTTYVDLDIENLIGNNFEIIVKETGAAGFQHKILFYGNEGQFLYALQEPTKNTEVTFKYISMLKASLKFKGRGVAFNARTNTKVVLPFYVIAIYEII